VSSFRYFAFGQKSGAYRVTHLRFVSSDCLFEYPKEPALVFALSEDSRSRNPRRIFDDAALNELAASIGTQGVISRLLVRPKAPQTFEVVVGRQRFRAAQLACLAH